MSQQVSLTAPADSRSGLTAFLHVVGQFLVGLPRAVRILLALCWVGLIWCLSSGLTPAVDNVPLGSVLGNFAHAPIFGVLGLFTIASLAPSAQTEASGVRWPDFELKHFAWAVGLVALYGLIDEIHQSFTPGRVPSLGDILTDGLGATAVMVTINRLHPAGWNGRGLLWLWGIALCVLLLSAACADFVGLPGFEAATDPSAG